MAEYSICVKNLSKNYGKKQALHHLDLELHKDQIIGLIGANGSGKTTFFKMCAGLEEITAGSIEVLGGDPWENMAVRGEMIYSMHDLPVAQGERLQRLLQYYEIAYPHFDRKFADKLLDLFDLPPKKKYKSLSQGMKSLFHFICALASRSQVTLLDEPFIGIDIEKRKMAYEILLRDYMEHTRTFVISSHNLAELEGVLSEMVLIHQGKLVFYQDMDAVREMLCRVSGSAEAVQEFQEQIPEQQILHRQSGSLGERLIVRCQTAEENQAGTEETAANAKTMGAGETAANMMGAEEIMAKAKRAGLDIEKVSPEDVCVYLTAADKEKELDSLWDQEVQNG